VNSIQTVLAIIGALFALAGVAGALYAQFRVAGYKARLDFKTDEAADYLQRLNWIEPRHRAAEQQLEVLLALHNPKDQLDDMQASVGEVVRIVRSIKTIAEQIDRELYRPRGERREGNPDA
jgi:hypothetical protein